MAQREKKKWERPVLTVLVRGGFAERVLAVCKKPEWYTGRLDQCIKSAVGSIYPLTEATDPCGVCSRNWGLECIPDCRAGTTPGTCWNGSYYSWWCYSQSLGAT